MRCLSLTTDRVPSSPQHGQAGWGTALLQCKQTKLHSSGQSWLGIKPNQKACYDSHASRAPLNLYSSQPGNSDLRGGGHSYIPHRPHDTPFAHTQCKTSQETQGRGAQ